jgi:predicted outer membrane repeat protein
MNDSNMTIINCTITGNIGGFIGPDNRVGGGICCTDDSSAAIINCTVKGNTAYRGGGIYCGDGSNLEITNCAITGNTAVDYGGGIYCYYLSSEQTITSCTITGNSSEHDGGGICCDNEIGTKISNCTIAGNFAEVYGGGILCYHKKPLINRSIFWGNSDISGTGQSAQIYDDGGIANLWFSCIQDDNPNDANIPFGDENFNIDDDPCFVEPGHWVDVNDPNIIVEPNNPNAVWLDGDYHLLPASPCVEIGVALLYLRSGRPGYRCSASSDGPIR